MLKLLTFWLLMSVVCCMEYKIVKSEQNEVRKIKVTSSVTSIEKHLFVNLSTLRQLEMVNVDVKKISENSFDDVPDLNGVELRENQITYIPKGAFSTRRIVEINLSSNKIVDIADYAFENMAELEYLDLSKNFLKNVDSTWFKDTPVQWVDLNNNHIVRIYKDAFAGLDKLYYLDISFNHIHFIEKETFSHCSTLTSLGVMANSLTNLDFLHNTYIQELYVSLNKLTSIKLAPSTTIKHIAIYPNPLRCKALTQFWKMARTRGMRIMSPKSSTVSWNNKYPICVSEDTFGDSASDEEKLKDLYFNVVDYAILCGYAKG